jgi:hypothetical protein
VPGTSNSLLLAEDRLSTRSRSVLTQVGGPRARRPSTMASKYTDKAKSKWNDHKPSQGVRGQVVRIHSPSGLKTSLFSDITKLSAPNRPVFLEQPGSPQQVQRLVQRPRLRSPLPAQGPVRLRSPSSSHQLRPRTTAAPNQRKTQRCYLALKLSRSQSSEPGASAERGQCPATGGRGRGRPKRPLPGQYDRSFD